jgi:hypothetical protein
VKRRRALLGSNPPRNSRWKLTAMSHEADVRVHAGLMRYETSFIAVDFECLKNPFGGRSFPLPRGRKSHRSDPRGRQRGG